MKLLIAPLILMAGITQSFEGIEKGVGLNEDNKRQLRSTSIPYAIARQGQRSTNNEGFVLAYFEMGEDVYSLSSEPTILRIKKDGRKVLDSWPLTPWPSHLFLEGENTSAVKAIAAVHGEEHTQTGDPLSILTDLKADYHIGNMNYLTFKTGCLQQSPLRYGDIETDSAKELVIMLGKNVVIFSPNSKEIIFSAHYWLDDEIANDEVADHFPGEILPTKAQYVASSGTDNLVREIYPAKRSMSKLYLGDFDNNGKNEIVIWRKMYESNLRNNPAIGFHKLAESSFHYERDTSGQYQLQADTAPETIQGWLTAKNLTWQSGFPSKSECAGQEGQLIPEMHDPLLNDPDVLK
jgi:hypothetical protein